MPTAHIESKLEDIAPIVLMPGDPLRAKYIAEHFLEDAKLINKVRNMFGYTGTYKGKRVTVFASGMGVPSIGIYSYELYNFYNVEKIIRIGTCGSFDKDIKLLDVILSTGAYCKSHFDELLDGVNIDFRKLKKGKVEFKLWDLGGQQRFRDSFPDMKFLGAEMEAFGLFYIARKLNKEAACLMTVVDSLFDKRSLSSEDREKSLDDMITLALESII